MRDTVGSAKLTDGVDGVPVATQAQTTARVDHPDQEGLPFDDEAEYVVEIEAFKKDA